MPDHARPGEPIDVRPLGPDLLGARTTALASNDGVEVVRMVVPAGRDVPTHTAPGLLFVQCLEGRVRFTALGRTQELEAGQLLYLPPHEPHSLQGIEDASLLLTIVLAPAATNTASKDDVREASEESFPASDAPGWTGTTHT